MSWDAWSSLGSGDGGAAPSAPSADPGSSSAPTYINPPDLPASGSSNPQNENPPVAFSGDKAASGLSQDAFGVDFGQAGASALSMVGQAPGMAYAAPLAAVGDIGSALLGQDAAQQGDNILTNISNIGVKGGPTVGGAVNLLAGGVNDVMGLGKTLANTAQAQFIRDADPFSKNPDGTLTEQQKRFVNDSLFGSLPSPLLGGSPMTGVNPAENVLHDVGDLAQQFKGVPIIGNIGDVFGDKYKTWGDVQKELTARGWTADDYNALKSGQKGALDFMDKGVNSNPLADAAFGLVANPLMFVPMVGVASGALRALSVATKIADTAEAAGWLSGVADAADGADIIANGAALTTQDATKVGLQSVGKYLGSTLSKVTDTAARVAASPVGSAVGKASKAYEYAGAATLAGEVGLRGAATLAGDINPQLVQPGGAFAWAKEVSDKLLADDLKLSQNQAFSLWASTRMGPGDVIKPITDVLGTGVTNFRGKTYNSNMGAIYKATVNELSKDYKGPASGREAYVTSKFEGGKQGLLNFIGFHAAKVAQNQFMPQALKDQLTYATSNMALGAKNRITDEYVKEAVPRLLQNGTITKQHIVQAIHDFYEHADPESNLSISFPWNEDAAVKLWESYRGQATQLHDFMNKVEDAGVALGYRGQMPNTVIMTVGERFKGIAEAHGGTIPYKDFASIIRENVALLTPMVSGRDATTLQQMLAKGEDIKGSQLKGILARATAHAPTVDALLAGFASAEREANAGRPQAPGRVQPASGLDFATIPGEASILWSAYNSSAHGSIPNSDSLNAVRAMRSDPEVQAFETNIGPVLQGHGINVSHTTQALGRWEAAGEPAMNVEFRAGTPLQEMRLAGSIAGLASNQRSVLLTITGAARMAAAGVEPNALHWELHLPTKNQAALAEVYRIIGQAFPDGSTLDDTHGIVSIFGPRDSLDVAKLEQIAKEVEGLYPKDDVGQTGIQHFVEDAYTELLSQRSSGHGERTYRQTLREYRADPRSNLGNVLERVRGLPAGRAVEDNRVSSPGERPPASPLDVVSPSQVYGFGSAKTLKVKPSSRYLYLTTTAKGAEEIARRGAIPKSPRGNIRWPDDAVIPRTYFSDDPAADAKPVTLRVRQAGLKLSTDQVSGQTWTDQGIASSSIAVLDGKGNWQPVVGYFDDPLGYVPPAMKELYDMASGPEQALADKMLRAAEANQPGPESIPSRQHVARAAAEDAKAASDPRSEAELLAELRGLLVGQGDEGFTPQHLEQAQRINLAIEAKRAATAADVRGRVIFNAARDADVAAKIPLPQLDQRNAGMSEEWQRKWASFERQLIQTGSAYTLTPPPAVAAMTRDFYGDQLLPQALLQHSKLYDWLSQTAPGVGRVSRFWGALTDPVSNQALGRAANTALKTELVAHGASPKQVDSFIAALRAEVKTFKAGPVQLFRTYHALPPSKIMAVAFGDGTHPGIFDEKVLKSLGSKDEIVRVMDRASNRMLRGLDARAARGGKTGALSRALDNAYTGFQKSRIGAANRYVTKTFYHLFRFIMDPRWWAMNSLEGDIIGLLRGGVDPIMSKDAGVDKGILVHEQHIHPGVTAKNIEEKLMNVDGGWDYNRKIVGIVGPIFRQERMESTLDALNALEKSDPVYRHLQELFGPDKESVAQGLDRMLYAYDSLGSVRKLGEQQLKELSLFNEKELSDPGLQSLLTKLWEQNDNTLKSLVETFNGNPARSNLERVLSSYWLYWPFSYQLKATKWLWSAMTKRFAGHNLNLAPAYVYSQLRQQHIDRLQSDPSYAAMFNKYPELWYMAQMLLPIGPEELGSVSLGRPTRYAGGWLGLWNNYSATKDPVTFATNVLEFGPNFTIATLGNIGKEIFP